MVLGAVVRTSMLLVVLNLLGTRATLVWISKPQHTAVLLGQNLVLNCQASAEASSGGSLSYKWLFNQTAVQDKASVFTNASLFVPQISVEDIGQYTCVVTLQNGGAAEVMSGTAEVILAYIEDFIMHPQSIQVPVGTEAELACVTGRSAPHPTVHWELDGVRLDGAKMSMATYGSYDPTGLSSQISMKLLYLVQDDEERVFRCAAVNTLTGQVVYSDEAIVTAKMTPMEPVIISPSFGQIVATENQRLTIPCLVTGYPPPMVLWYKDTDYVDDSRVYVLADWTLVIPEVGREDAGTYRCEAKNSLGVVTSNDTTVLVAEIGLQFRAEPSDTTSLAGHPVTLHCSPPHSVPPALVTWYKDYTPFVERSGQFAATVVRSEPESWDLVFSSVQESDEGEYYCVASNNFSVPTSRTSQVARLTVYGAPVITQPPVNTDVLKGTMLHLTCMVNLATVQLVYWIFDGRRVEASQTVSITDHGQNLWISNVGKSWEGHYICVAENVYGQKTASATVTVIVPPVTLQDLGARSVMNGSVILLPCFIYSAPDPTFVWYHDGQIVTGDNRRKLLSTGLFIDPVTTADRGNYSCKGVNRAGHTWSNGTLEIRVLPSIVANRSATAVLGQSLTLTCMIEGHPRPSVYWLHNGTTVSSKSAIPANGEAVFRRGAFIWSMSGKYTCVAENEDGTSRADISVAVQVVPRVTAIEGKTAVDISRSINLTCVHYGVPAPTVMWYHDGKEIEASLDGRIQFPTPDQLLIRFSQKSDAGRYTCRATNDLGRGSNSVDVIIVEPPRPPQLVEVRPVSMNSVFLRWEPVVQPPATTVDSFTIHYRVRVAGELTMYPKKLSALTTQWEVNGLEPGTEYVFTVSAENSAGVGLPSNSLTAVTFESGPSAPRNVQVLSTEATRLTVSWEVPADTNGNIQQYQLQYRRQAVDAVYTELSVSSPVLPTQVVRLDGLTPYTTYELRVRAANLWGATMLWGQFSPLTTVHTSMAKPSGPPANIRAAAIDPYTVRVEWHPVPEVSQHGPITGYRLTFSFENEATPLQIILANSSQYSVTVRGLAPWTQYSLTVEAQNQIGFGPKSEIIRVRTLPALPSAPPQGVTAASMPGNLISVRWQPVPRKDVNCELSSYLLQYRQAGAALWNNITTGNNSTFSVNISDAIPWSWYEIRVAPVTIQLSPGLGPFSASVEVQTLQAAAGPVTSVSFTSALTSISLSWLAPVYPNGIVTGYRLDFRPVSDPLAERKTVVMNVTHAVLHPLLSDILYNVSIAALNQAGIGTPTVLLIRTSSALTTGISTMTTTVKFRPTREAYTLDQIERTTTASEGSSSSSRDLPAIVAGSLTGVVVLLIILIVFLCRCVKLRREHHAKYLIQDPRGASSSSYRHIEESDTSVIITSRQSVSPSSSDQNFQQQQQQQKSHQPLQHKDSAPQQLTDTSWLAQQAQRMEGGAEGPPVYLPGTAMFGMSTPPVSPGGSDVFIIDGIDNPAFMEDPVPLPGLPPPDRTSTPSGAACPEEMDKRTSTASRKRGRMRSESAAAIAVMRSANSATLTADDTESLLTNEFTNVDTEVVFKHRTVL